MSECFVTDGLLLDRGALGTRQIRLSVLAREDLFSCSLHDRYSPLFKRVESKGGLSARFIMGSFVIKDPMFERALALRLIPGLHSF